METQSRHSQSHHHQDKKSEFFRKLPARMVEEEVCRVFPTSLSLFSLCVPLPQLDAGVVKISLMIWELLIEIFGKRLKRFNSTRLTN